MYCLISSNVSRVGVGINIYATTGTFLSHRAVSNSFKVFLTLYSLCESAQLTSPTL